MTDWQSVIRITYYIGPLALWFCALFILFAVSKVLKHPDGVFKSQAIASFFVMGGMLNMYVFYKILNVFNCVEFMGDRVMMDDFSVVCGSEEYSTPAV